MSNVIAAASAFNSTTKLLDTSMVMSYTLVHSNILEKIKFLPVGGVLFISV